jgi:hypothetical protein
MKETMNRWGFINGMVKYGGGEGFSYAGLNALWDYLESYEEDTGKELEFDPVEFRCEFTEYFDINEYNDDYGEDKESYEDIDETTVIPVDEKRFIIVDY